MPILGGPGGGETAGELEETCHVHHDLLGLGWPVVPVLHIHPPGTVGDGGGIAEGEPVCESEGEVCGVAVEGSMNTVLTVDVIKERYCDWPRFEDDLFIMTAGSIRPLEDAFRIAHTQLIHWLVDATGLSVMDAYQLVSQVSLSPIANVVDTNYTVLAKFPKRFLPTGLTVMSGRHAALQDVGRRYLGALAPPPR